jgi:quinol monooxygenase YgiN
VTAEAGAVSRVARWCKAAGLCRAGKFASPTQQEREQVNKTICGLLFLAAIALVSSREDAMALPGTTYINAVDLDIVPSERDKFLAAIAEDAAATIKEPGCLQFDVLVLADDPNHLFLYEVYQSEAAFRAHRETENFKKYASTTASMVAKRVTRTMTALSFAEKPH